MNRLSCTSFRKIILVGIGCVVAGLLTGCVTHLMTPDQKTTWYLQPSGAYDMIDGKAFLGVGKAARLQNRTLQRVSADNQARLEMARLLDKYSVALSRSAAPKGVRKAYVPEDLEPALKGLVKQAMQRAIVTDHWADPDQGRLFALCRLNLADFKAALKAHQGLGAALRANMLSNLEVVHAQLSQGLRQNQ